MRHLLTLSFFILIFPFARLHAQSQADQLTQQVMEARARGDFEQAIQLNEQEIELRRKDPLSSKLYLANSIHTQAANYAGLQHYDQAIDIEKEALELFRKADKKKQYIGICLNNLAAYHFSRGQSSDFAMAEAYAQEALKYEESGTENYVNTLNLLVVYQTVAGHAVKANDLSKQLFKQGKRVYGLNTVKYAEILGNQSVKLANLGNFAEAIKYAEEGISIYSESGDTLNLSFARLLTNTANYYSNKEDYATTVEKLERARAILLAVEGQSGLNYIQCTGELSAAYNHLGDLQKADDLANVAQNSITSADERTTLLKAQSLKKQAEVFATNGNYKVAISLQNAVLGILGQYADSLGMAKAYDRLSNYYYHDKNLDKAIECCQKAIDIYSRNNGKQTDLAQAYNSMSIYHYQQGDNEAALNQALQAVQMYAAVGDTTSSFYAKALTNTALYHYASGHLDDAVHDALHSYHLQREVLGEGHPDNVTNLFNLSHYYYSKGDEQKHQEYLHKAMQLQSSLVKKNFSHMTTAGRELYWNSKRFVFSVAPTYAYLCADNDSLVADAYNAQLFTKGILLNSEIDFKALLMHSGDSILLEEYLKLTDLNNQIDELYSASAQENSTDNHANEIEQLKRKATMLERDLMRHSKEYGDYTANMTLSAHDIAAVLKEGDVAVELFEIDVDGGKAYYAIYMKKDWKAPRLVKLFNYLDLRALQHNGKDFYQLFADREGINYLFSESEVGHMVWNPLIQSWGDDVKNVYFSPSGLFYQWGIEYLQLNDGQRIGEKYDMHRLSSTKLLAQTPESHAIKNAVVFGGLDYDVPAELMAELHNGVSNYTNTLVAAAEDEDLTLQRSLFDLDNSVVDSLSLRGSVHFLTGSLNEANNIAEQLMQNNIETQLYTYEQGIEENFKALSGKQQSLIHIATHGFSLGEGHAGRMKLASILGGTWNATVSDANLNYSGLLLSGANNALNGIKLPDGVENGILTSREISMLDLRGTDMIVLSACQTGLGDIKEDGVFGLQRGFKKAGAQTLLMSLWSVDDQATQLMMTSFYRALMEGKSRHEAFEEAQSQVRSTPKFSSPFFWASFIMLDDL